jgi:hypothetical protein
MGDGPTGAPLVRKLGVVPGNRVRLVHAPGDWTIDGLPAGVRVLSARPSGAPVDVMVSFFRRRADLEREAPGLAKAITPDGALWLAWPRRAAGHSSDITDVLVRNAVLAHGLVDVKVAALGEDWSGLKFV